MEKSDLEKTVETEPWNNNTQFIFGFANGFYRVADPIGALVSYGTDIRTLGGSAWRGEIEAFGKKHPSLNAESSYYKVGQGMGFFLGGVTQYNTFGFPQLLMGAIDLYFYIKNKGLNAEKYSSGS